MLEKLSKKVECVPPHQLFWSSFLPQDKFTQKTFGEVFNNNHELGMGQATKFQFWA